MEIWAIYLDLRYFQAKSRILLDAVVLKKVIHYLVISEITR